MLFETKAAKYWFEKINQTWNGVLRINCTIAGKMFWKDGLSKIALEYDLSCIIRKDFFLHKKVILFFRRKIEDHLIQIDKWKHDIFCLFGKDGYLVFPEDNIILFSKMQRWSSLEKYITGIIGKDDVHPRIHDIFSDRKIKDDNKIYSVKFA